MAVAFFTDAIDVVFFPLTGSSGRPPFDEAGTADAVISSARKRQLWMMARILDLCYESLPLFSLSFGSHSSYRESKRGFRSEPANKESR